MEILTIITKAFAPLKELLSYFFKKWWPPKYGYKLAHSNILEVIRPYVHLDKVVELLGQPHQWEEDRAGYRFANALLQVNYLENSVRSVCLVLLRHRWPNRFSIFPIPLSLGASTFADACAHDVSDGRLALRLNFSSKFYCLWSEQYFGNPGRYFYYSFALLEADTFPVTIMPKCDYTNHELGHVEQGAILNDVKVKFNAVSISRCEGEYFCFDFTLFR